jgi:hypothetical protein
MGVKDFPKFLRNDLPVFSNDKKKAFDTEWVVEMSETFVFYEMLPCGSFYGQNTEGVVLSPN